MSLFRLLSNQACLLVLLLAPCSAQEPVVDPSPKTKPAPGDISAAALEGSKQDPAAVARGSRVFAAYCAGCHGAGAKGGPGAPDLIRSVLVLDDEKGILIGPVIRDGRPDQGMPKLGLTEPQIADVVAWLHTRTYAAGHRVTYAFQDVVTGDARKGEAYFQSTCASCHSAQNDLAGIGRKYDSLSLQTRWLQPQSGRDHHREVTVTTASGESVAGVLEFINDFNVALRDGHGQYHSFARRGNSPAVVVTDPMQAHTDLLSKYTDADIHNLTAYLVTLK